MLIDNTVSIYHPIELIENVKKYHRCIFSVVRWFTYFSWARAYYPILEPPKFTYEKDKAAVFQERKENRIHQLHNNKYTFFSSTHQNKSWVQLPMWAQNIFSKFVGPKLSRSCARIYCEAPLAITYHIGSLSKWQYCTRAKSKTRWFVW